jgi:NAD(P)H-flavin reductase/hemoglobin-like flavoprotein
MSDAAMTYFYGHLFAAEPEIRAMFPAAMDAQRQRFYQALCQIAASGPGDLSSDLAALGRAHRKYGVRKEHYDTFRVALQATFRRFAPNARWEDAFDRAAGAMVMAAEEDATRAPAWWTAEVTDHQTPVPQVAVLTLRPDAPLPYLPGQHITVQTPHWPRVWRRYSIANAPREDGTLTVHVRAVPGGLVSTSLLHTKPGDTLVLGPAEGTMTADTQSGRDVLCLAGGTGLAPVKAITEAIGQTSAPGRRREITLYFGARTERLLYDLPALRAMELDYPWLQVVPVTSDPAGPDIMHGTVPDIVAVAPWTDRDVYISGPDAMIVATVSALRDRGAPPEQLHYDLPTAFGATCGISDILRYYTKFHPCGLPAMRRMHDK